MMRGSGTDIDLTQSGDAFETPSTAFSLDTVVDVLRVSLS